MAQDLKHTHLKHRGIKSFFNVDECRDVIQVYRKRVDDLKVDFLEGDARNRSIRLPNEVGTTNQVSEAVGAKTAAEEAPLNWELKLISDSRLVLDGLSRHFVRWENQGYFLVANSLVMQTMVARFRARGTPTRLKWVKGHSGNPGNEGADILAGLASRKKTPDLIDLTIPPELRTRGAKLAALSQGTAYEIIKKTKMQTETYQNKMDRRDTNDNVELALAAASERSHISCEERELCQVCHTEDSMDHILTQCQTIGQEEVWTLAQELWRQKTGSDLIITKGIIMSCGIHPLELHKSATKRTTERFRCILISESAHLIWKIRNDRVINEKEQYTKQEVEHQWLNAMNRRMKLDCLLSDGKKFKKKVIKVPLVLGTWRGTLLRESTLPDDWTKGIRVLVGIVK
ncbi:hypothetical protein IW261DRAFT_1551350 [Armillaria novae-zelandiae]|uniref:RNase H type-1 domain-containing protein n=1 Tax=Armillaria novae-zelandiae TaxID=153914 RepID=A0AA39P9C1_9AGAR|nr:hypothetical protein IW261DRAFT_1551350 [Armillaria novae-zelandiae]